MEVNNPKAATDITAEANDVVMADANVTPEANEAPTATVVPEVQASEATAAPEVNAEAPEVQAPEANMAPEAHDDKTLEDEVAVAFRAFSSILPWVKVRRDGNNNMLCAFLQFTVSTDSSSTDCVELADSSAE